MPLQNCSANGTSGWRWGEQGKCYTGPGAKKKAIRQGLAENGGKLDAFVQELTVEELAEVVADSEVPMLTRLELGKALREQRKIDAICN